jgi:hypothetical protein
MSQRNRWEKYNICLLYIFLKEKGKGRHIKILKSAKSFVYPLKALQNKCKDCESAAHCYCNNSVKCILPLPRLKI